MASSATRFAGPALLSNADAQLWAVPSATKDVIRHVHIENNDQANSHTLFMSLGADTAANRIYDAYVIAAGAILDAYPYYPCEAALSIRGHADASNVLGYTIAGDRITL